MLNNNIPVNLPVIYQLLYQLRLNATIYDVINMTLIPHIARAFNSINFTLQLCYVSVQGKVVHMISLLTSKALTWPIAMQDSRQVADYILDFHTLAMEGR